MGAWRRSRASLPVATIPKPLALLCWRLLALVGSQSVLPPHRPSFLLESGPWPCSKGMEEFPWLVPLLLWLLTAASQHSGMDPDVCCHLRPTIKNAKAGRELGPGCSLDFPQSCVSSGALLSHGAKARQREGYGGQREVLSETDCPYGDASCAFAAQSLHRGENNFCPGIHMRPELCQLFD